MPSKTRTDPAPVSRARPPLLGIVPLAALLATLVAPAAAQRTPCLPGCDPMNRTDACCPSCLGAACDDFRACQESNRLFVEDCVHPACDRGTAGRCTITLECVRGCRARVDDCTGRLKRNLQTDCGACRIGRGTARRTCDFCTGRDSRPAAACAGDGGEGDGSSCQRQCIRRQQRVKDCYQKCNSRCEGDRCAIPICERACRDAVCASLAKRCSLGNPKTDRRYIKCCQDPDQDCDEDGADTIACETTTSTTSSTSTTATTSTTARTTTTSTTLP